MDALRRDEVDGIPVWWVPAPGPLTATLAFRVGLADEPFAHLGITHLVEHLSLFPLGRQRYDYNATVDDTDTTFRVTGSREEVLGHLRAVAANLKALPLERFEDELRVLQAEGRGRTNGLKAFFLRQRYGSRTYGLRSKRELGLRGLTPEQAQAWATERFTRENAVLWMTGEPPETLGLDLPSGRRFPAPPADSLPRVELPAYIADEDQTVAVAVVAGREDFEALRTALAVARARLYDRLRRDCAIIYDVALDHTIVGPGGIHAHLAVDCRHEDAERVRDAVLGTLADLAEHGPTADELDFEVDQTRRWVEDPTGNGARASDAALDELYGVPSSDPMEVVRALTPERCARALADALGTALVMAPDQLESVPDGLTPYAKNTLEGPAPEGGRAFRELDETECLRRPCLVTVSDDAIHWKAGDGSSAVLVPREELVGIVREAGDSHLLYLADGSTLDLSPLAFENGDALREALVAVVGAENAIPLDVRGRRVEEQGERDLQRRPMLTEELYRLSRDIYEDEEVLRLAEPEDRDGPGLFAVTDRRIIMHYVARGADGDEDYRRETARSQLSDVRTETDEDGATFLAFRIGDAEDLTNVGPLDPDSAAALVEALGADDRAVAQA